MARSPDNLPEGTDSIIPGATIDELNDVSRPYTPPIAPATDGMSELPPATASASSGAAHAAADIGTEAKHAFTEKTTGLRDQAADTVRSYALQGKDRATDAIDNVVRLVDDAAATIDEKVGEQYGDYVRRASETLSGFATTLRDKDVDDLVDDARNVVRSSPALAIGAAAAVGFLVARVVKAGVTPSTDTDDTVAETPSSSSAA